MSSLLQYYIYFIILVKVLFYLLLILYAYYDFNNKLETPTGLLVSFWNQKIDILFVACMSVLLIIIFNPRNKTKFELTYEIKFLLTMYGIITLVKLNWKELFNSKLKDKEIKKQKVFDYK